MNIFYHFFTKLLKYLCKIDILFQISPYSELAHKKSFFKYIIHITGQERDKPTVDHLRMLRIVCTHPLNLLLVVCSHLHIHHNTAYISDGAFKNIGIAVTLCAMIHHCAALLERQMPKSASVTSFADSAHNAVTEAEGNLTSLYAGHIKSVGIGILSAVGISRLYHIHKSLLYQLIEAFIEVKKLNDAVLYYD